MVAEPATGFHPWVLALMLFAGLGGFLGIFLAVYLTRIRETPAHPAVIFATFAIGVRMLLTTSRIPETTNGLVETTATVGTMILLVIAEIMLFGMHTHPNAGDDIRRWMYDEPRFVWLPGSDRPDENGHRNDSKYDNGQNDTTTTTTTTETDTETDTTTATVARDDGTRPTETNRD